MEFNVVAARGAFQDERQHGEQRKERNEDELTVGSHEVMVRAQNRNAMPGVPLRMSSRSSAKSEGALIWR